MLGRRRTIFLTPYVQFEKRFGFLFEYVMNMRDDLLCLPSWHHGRDVDFYYQISVVRVAHRLAMTTGCGVSSSIPGASSS